LNEINKVSEIAVNDLADYLRIEELTYEDEKTLSNLLIVAKEFIKNYTGQTDLDNFPDFVIVVLVLVQDMYDNRTMYVNTNNLNTVIESILGMHSINLL
jgi:hypothetical protein